MSVALKLYTNPMSRGRTVRWMLEELGEPYEAQFLDYGAPMKSPEYLAINPAGKVPALVHGSHVVTEVAAICTYLADAFPQAGLAPPLQERAGYYRWLFFAAGPLESAITNASLGLELPEDKWSMVGYSPLVTLFDLLEQAMDKGPYLAGDAFSVADVVVGSQIGFGLQFGTVEKRPAFQAYWERITAREAHQRASAIDNAAMAG